MKLFKPLLLSLGVILALVIVAELIVRLAFPVPMEPGATLTLKNEIEGVKQSVGFRFDGDRLRSIGWSKGKESKNLRILCIGGNGTISILQSAEDTWWGQLAAEVGKAKGIDRQVEVAAIAHLPDGKITTGLAEAHRLLGRYKVDLVICSFGFADAFGQPGNYQRDPDRLQKLLARPERGDLKYRLAKASHLVRIVRNSRTSKGHRQRQGQIGQVNYYKELLSTANRFYMSCPGVTTLTRTGDDPLDEFVAGVNGFISLAKAQGAKLLIVGEPTIYKSELTAAEIAALTVPYRTSTEVENGAVRVMPVAVERELQRFNKAAEAACAATGTSWYNLQGDIPRFADHFLTETYLTDKGSKAVAAKLLEPVLGALRQ